MNQTNHFHRRGMLILLVLSMLTLFLLMGAVGLVLATRAREASRAFATAAAPQGSRTMMAKPLLEAALLKLVRGPAGPLGESLLEDMYGPPQNGTLTAVAPQAGTPLLRATITGLNTAKPMTLNGRLVTFKPSAGDASDPVTYRVVRTDGSGIFWLWNMRPYTPMPLPSGTCAVIVNGRAFTAEPYDAFDGANAFLAKLDVDGSGAVTVQRPSFTNGQPLKVDNDNDGVADGVWLSDVLPARPAIGGGTVTLKVSYLVVDLDGRINLNAHGATAGNSKPGLGPADLDAASIFTADTWALLMVGGDQTRQADNPTEEQRRPAPKVAVGVDGRYGRIADPDQPFDPYQLRLDSDGRRSGDAAAGGQNLFTPGELERILRQFDRDASTLPPRLAAILDSRAQRARMLVTTDSWDTPGLVGVAASSTIDKADPATIAPDAVSGRRFDLNRSWNVNSVEDRRAYFEDLYRVVVAAGAPADTKTAQWVANVVAFRDDDPTQQHDYEVPGVGNVKGLKPPVQFGAWNLGEFRSAADLLAVPDVSDMEFQAHLNANTVHLISSLAKTVPAILDAVIVPSRFTGSTLTVDPASLTAVGMNDLRTNQLSRWREPGRVNVNTCPRDVWEVVRGKSEANPFASGAPAKGVHDIMERVFGDPEINLNCVPMATVERDAANRLCNVATVRSHVFAVWITLQIEDTSPNAEPPTFHRLFAIVDRSVPVGCSPGENLNVRDAIRLQRFLE